MKIISKIIALTFLFAQAQIYSAAYLSPHDLSEAETSSAEEKAEKQYNDEATKKMWQVLLDARNEGILKDYSKYDEQLNSALAAGANPNMRLSSSIDSLEPTPLDAAVKTGSTSLVTILWAYGADPSKKNDLNQLPLHTAPWVGRSALKISKILLSRKHLDQVNERDDFDQTPLSQALYRPQIVELLLAHGADPSIKDKKGRNAIARTLDQISTNTSPELKETLKILTEYNREQEHEKTIKELKADSSLFHTAPPGLATMVADYTVGPLEALDEELDKK